MAPALVRGGLRAYASAGWQSGLLAIDLGTNVNISLVSTAPAARRRGPAGAVLAAALRDAAERGWLTASLQATPMAESLYARSG